ncbi:MAG TPA: hypothetical protein VF401_03750 [Candidatus Saccharimonadales bacterium]
MADTDKDAPQAMQPGQIITPGGASPTQAAPPPAPAPAPPAPVVQPTPEPAPAPPVVSASPELAQQLPPQSDLTLSNDQSSISWTASEFAAHEKSANWYLSLAGVAVLLSAAIYLATRDAVSSVVVVVTGILMGIYAARKPRQLTYRLTPTGVGIGEKHFPYEAFRSFSIVDEGAFSSIVLLPLKRFAPLITIYFAAEDEDTIADVLSEQLPYAEFHFDAVDNLMRRIRF